MKLTTRRLTNVAAKRRLKKLNARINSGRMFLLNDFEDSGESEFAHKRRLTKIMTDLGAIDDKIIKWKQHDDKALTPLHTL